MASSLQIPVTAVGLEQSIQDAIKKAGTNAHLNFGQGSSHISSLSQPLGKLTGQADQFASSMKAANARVLAFGASVGIINAVSNAFKTMLQDAIGVEKSLADINSVLGESSSALEKFGNTLFDVAKNTGQSFKTVAEGALELARQGLGTEETLKRINDALVLSRLSGLDAAASVEGLTAAYNSFKETGISTHEIVNKLVAVSQKYAVSERDLIEGLKRSSSVADQAGVSLDELIGVITAVQERTARGGAVIGNSFKTIFSKIQDKAVLQDLNDIGVEVMDMQGKILPATKVLQNLSKVMSTLSQTEQMDIEKKLGGVYQLSNLLAALKDMSSEQSKYTESVKVSQNASNEAFQKNAALNETFAALLNRVSLSAEQLGSTLAKLGVTDNLKGLIGFFNGIMESIQKILGQDDTLGTMFKGLAKGIGALFSGPGLMLFGAIILKLSKDLAQFGFNSLKGFFGVGQAAKEIKSIEESVAAALMTNVSLQQKLFALEGNRAAQLKVISDQIIIQEAGLRNITSISKGMSVGLYSAGVRTSEQGLRIPAKADGFLPAVAQESSSIQRGVGGARSGDRPVVIPNFSFGGGMTGPMVAHTGEVMVPNFANGGSAIFNRNMVASMGMPAGAQRIGAARGFIPNFAKDIVIDARALGGLGAASISKENKGDFANTSTKFTSLGKSEQAILMSIFGGDSKGLNNSNVSMTNIETRELKNFGGSDRQKSFRQAVNTRIGPSLVDLSRDLFGNGIFSSKHESGLKAGFQNEKNDPHIFSDGVLGGLFESAVMTATKSIEKMGEFQAGNNPAFDFESDGSPDRKFQNAFGFGNIIKADAKKTGDHDPYRTFIGKALRDLEVRRKIIEVYAPQKNEEGVKESLSLGVKTGRKNLTFEEQKPSKEFPMGRSPGGGARTRYSSDFEGMYNFSSGYIPNFASPIQEAISREASSGVSPSQIYIDRNPSLVNSGNPMGMMVANRRDEPSGGSQGISRAIREGRNPQTYGAANGFVPNYADPLTMGIGPTGVGVKQSKPISDNLDKLNKLIEDLNKDIAANIKTYEEAKKAVDGFVQGIKGKTTEQTKVKVADAAKKQLTAPEPEAPKKGSRDMLGTIFALQAGLSMLSGATDGATSSFAKYTNIISDSLSKGTSVMFAAQGLKSLAQEGSKLAGALGTAGMVLSTVVAGWELGKGIYDEASGANKLAAENTAKLSEAAKNAAMSLDQYRPMDKQKIEQTTKDLLYNLKSGQISKTGGYQTYSPQDPNAKLRSTLLLNKEEENNLSESIKLALSSGIESIEVGKILMDKSGASYFITKEIASSIENALSKLSDNPGLKKAIEDIRFAQEEAGKDSELGRFLQRKIGPDSNLKNANFKGAARKYFGSDNPAYTSLISSAFESVRKKKKESQYEERVSSQEYREIGKKMQMEASITSRIQQETNALANQELLTAKELSKIKIDTNLSEEGRISQLAEAEFRNKNIAKSLADQKTLIENITESAKDASKLGGPDQRSNIFQKVSSLGEDLIKNPRDEAMRLLRSGKIDDAKENIESRLQNVLPGMNPTVYEGIASKLILILAKNRDLINASSEQLIIDKKIFDLAQETAKAERENAFNSNLKLNNAKEEVALAGQLLSLKTQSMSKDEFANRLALNNLQQPKINETELQSMRRSARASFLTRENITPAEQSRSIEEIKNKTLKELQDRVLSRQNTQGMSTSDIEAMNKKIGFETDLNKLKELGGKDYEETFNKILKNQDQEIANIKERNETTKAGISLEEQRLSLFEKQGQFKTGIGEAMTSMRSETEMFYYTIGKDLPKAFASNMSQAMVELIDSGKSFGDVMRGAAYNFVKEMNSSMIKNLVNSTISSGGGILSSIGSLFHASGGPITGGSGTKDDVPAVLMGGEYVINKNSVSKYGQGFLSAVNNGTLKAFADGGLAQNGPQGNYFIPGQYGMGDITGRSNLLNFATQTATGGSHDSAINDRNYSSVSLEAESSSLTSFGRRTGPMADALRSAKEQAFGLYIQDYQAEQARKEAEKQQSKALKNQLMMMGILTVGGAALKAGATGFGNAYSSNAGGFGSKMMAGVQGIWSGGDIGNGTIGGGLSNLFSSTAFLGRIPRAIPVGQAELSKSFSGMSSKGGEYTATAYGLASIDPTTAQDQAKADAGVKGYAGFSQTTGSSGRTLVPGYSVASNKFALGTILQIGGKEFRVDDTGGMGSNVIDFYAGGDKALYKMFSNMGSLNPIVKRATGGSIPNSSGIDTIPSMLSGGEFVMNRSAAQNIGSGNLQALNSGASSLPTEDQAQELNDKIVAKLDELIKSSSGGGDITINVDSSTGKSTEQKDNDTTDTRNQLASQIKQAVLKVIQDEKRLGGSLRI